MSLPHPAAHGKKSIDAIVIMQALKCINKFSEFWYRRGDIIEGISGTSPSVQRFQDAGFVRQLSGKDVNGNTGGLGAVIAPYS